jgi:hypothetical protein
VRTKRAVPFEDTAPIVDPSPAAARQIVDAFVEAARGDDIDGLLAMLAPTSSCAPTTAAANLTIYRCSS